MNEYFKDQFNPVFKQWKEGERKSTKAMKRGKTFIHYFNSTKAATEKL